MTRPQGISSAAAYIEGAQRDLAEARKLIDVLRLEFTEKTALEIHRMLHLAESGSGCAKSELDRLIAAHPRPPVVASTAK